MGILGRLQTGDLSTRIATATPAIAEAPMCTATASTVKATTTAAQAAPSGPCDVCRGLLWWLDAYGLWRCHGCARPPAPALARRLVVVAPGRDGQAAAIDDAGPEFGLPVDLDELGVWLEYLPARNRGRREWRRAGALWEPIYAEWWLNG